MLPLENSAILSTCIKLPFIIKILVLSVFEWSLKTGFTVSTNSNYYLNTFGPRHEKTSNATIRKEKTQVSLGISLACSESLLSARKKIGSIVTQCSTYTHFAGFAMSWFVWI